MAKKQETKQEKGTRIVRPGSERFKEQGKRLLRALAIAEKSADAVMNVRGFEPSEEAVEFLREQANRRISLITNRLKEGPRVATNGSDSEIAWPDDLGEEKKPEAA